MQVRSLSSGWRWRETWFVFSLLSPLFLPLLFQVSSFVTRERERERDKREREREECCDSVRKGSLKTESGKKRTWRVKI